MFPPQLLKKYRASTSSLCAAQAEAREAASRADAALEEARSAKDKLTELTARLAHAEAGHSQGHAEAERRLELRNKVIFKLRHKYHPLSYFFLVYIDHLTYIINLCKLFYEYYTIQNFYC